MKMGVGAHYTLQNQATFTMRYENITMTDVALPFNINEYYFHR